MVALVTLHHRGSLAKPGEVSTLQHELRDNPVEDRSLVVQRLARFAHALLASAQRPEVLHSFWNDVSKQPHYNSTCIAPPRSVAQPLPQEDKA